MNPLLRVALVLSVALAGAVQAAPMSASVPGVGTLRNDNVNGTGFSSVSVTAPGFSGRAGEFTGYFYPGAFAADSFFRFFCAEIGQSAVASATYTASLWHNENLKRLFDTAFPNKTLGDFYDGGITAFGDFASANAAAAFQLAIWEIIFDPADLDLNGGVFHVTGGSPAAITALSQGWLDALGASTTWNRWSVISFTNPNRQDYVSAIYKVSEPPLLALLGAGLALLIVARRKRH